MANDSEVNIKITATAQTKAIEKTEKALEGVNKETEKTEKALEEVNKEIEKTEKALEEVNRQLKTNNELTEEQFKLIQKNRSDLKEKLAAQKAEIEATKDQIQEGGKLERALNKLGSGINRVKAGWSKLTLAVGVAVGAFALAKNATQKLLDKIKDLKDGVTEAGLAFDKMEQTAAKASREEFVEAFERQSEAIKEASEKAVAALDREIKAARELARVGLELAESEDAVNLAEIDASSDAPQVKAQKRFAIAQKKAARERKSANAKLDSEEKEAKERLDLKKKERAAKQREIDAIDVSIENRVRIDAEESKFRDEEHNLRKRTTSQVIAESLTPDSLLPFSRDDRVAEARDRTQRRVHEIRAEDPALVQTDARTARTRRATLVEELAAIDAGIAPDQKAFDAQKSNNQTRRTINANEHKAARIRSITAQSRAIEIANNAEIAREKKEAKEKETDQAKIDGAPFEHAKKAARDLKRIDSALKREQEGRNPPGVGNTIRGAHNTLAEELLTPGNEKDEFRRLAETMLEASRQLTTLKQKSGATSIIIERVVAEQKKGMSAINQLRGGAQ